MKSNKFLIIFLIFISEIVYGQSLKSRYHFDYYVINGDTIQVIYVPSIPVYSKKRRSKMDLKRYERLARAVKLTYPIAIEASRKLREMEHTIDSIKTKRGQDKYVKNVEDSLKKEYMPLLKQMSMFQGMVLLKLIDRQTGHTSYKLVQDLRGKLPAVFWQGMARLFGGSLKVEYDKFGDDLVIEELIGLYEAGLL